jgi:hypothetical protein
MLALKTIASERMIETVFSVFPVHERKVASLMFHVAELAFVILLPAMQSDAVA